MSCRTKIPPIDFAAKTRQSKCVSALAPVLVPALALVRVLVPVT